MMPIDHNGKPIPEGSTVRLLSAPAELLRGLPQEDQAAIEWAAKEGQLTIVGHDRFGNVELEFDDPSGTTHFIFVNPERVVAA